MKKSQRFFVILLAIFLIIEIMFLGFEMTGNPILRSAKKIINPSQEIGGLGDVEMLTYKLTSDKSSFKIIKEGEYNKIEIKGFDVISFEEGLPSLPEKSYNYVLPAGNKVKEIRIINKVDSEYSTDKQIKFNSKPIKTCSDCSPSGCVIEKDLGANQEIYSSDFFYPGVPIKLVFENSVAGRNVISVVFSPVQYNPVTGKIILTESVDFEIILEEDKVRTTYNDRIETLIPLVENKELIEIKQDKSSSEVEYYNEDSNVDYLIITNDELKPYYEPLAEWKRQKGLNAKIVTIDEVYEYVDVLFELSPRDNAEKLRFYLRDLYNNKGLGWVLLGGDEDVLPIRYSYHSSTSSEIDLDQQHIADLYFSDMDGDWNLDQDNVWGETVDGVDLGADVFVARIPLKTPEDTQAIVEKMIQYEKNPGNGNPDYVLSAVLFGADHLINPWYNPTQPELVAEHIPYNFNKDFNSLNEKPSGDDANPISPFGWQVIGELNNGYGIISYFTHGSPTGIIVKSKGYVHVPRSYVVSNPSNEGLNSIDNIENNNKPSFVSSISCGNAMFDADKIPLYSGYPPPFIVEGFLKQPNSGAFAFLGNTRWGWVGISYQLIQKFFDYSLNLDQQPLAIALANTKLSFYYYRDQVFTVNLYGDPETRLYTEIPEQLTQEISGDENEIVVDVSQNSVPVNEATVTLTNSQGEYLKSITDSNGQAIFDLNQFSLGINGLIVTSFKYNTIPAQISCVNPSATEVCDYVDNNCNGIVDLDNSNCLCESHPGYSCTGKQYCENLAQYSILRGAKYHCTQPGAVCCGPVKPVIR